ncbi:MAG: RNA polymerase sigma factor RpoD/SigA [Isosphaeraceae bacterium]
MTCLQAKDCGASDLLNTYLREIRDDALLSAAEERSLAAAIAEGDANARSRMIQANLRLVVKIAREYVGRGMVLDDLIGEGNLGLIRAAEEYDPGFGTRFSTYASYWIKQAIRHALINTTATIRLPAHMVGLLTKWRRAERTLTKELGRAPTPDEVAVSLGLTDAQKGLVEKARRARQLRLESGGGEDGGNWSPDESVDDNNGESPDAMLEADDERQSLMRRLERLDARERAILSLRFGLGGELPLTLKEVGRRLGVTREWVRKIEIRAVRKLDDSHQAEAPAEPARTPARARKLPASPVRRNSAPARSVGNLVACYTARADPITPKTPRPPRRTSIVAAGLPVPGAPRYNTGLPGRTLRRGRPAGRGGGDWR